MDVKAYLGQVKQAERGIAALLERRQRCDDMARRRGLGQSAALEALDAELDRRIEGYAALVRDAEELIDALEDGQCREVLRYRYLNGWSWQRIAGHMHYTQDWLWRVHARGPEALEWEIEKNTEKTSFGVII